MHRLSNGRSGRTAATGTFVTVAALLMQLGYVGTAKADDDDITRITFDERPTRPAHGLRVEGVRFGFRIDGVPSEDALFNAFGPGDTRFVSDPSLEGTTSGVLTLRFAEETEVVRFGLAVSCFDCVIKSGATVRLFDDDGDLVRFARLTTRPLVSFSEARFSFEDDDVERAVIHFNKRRADRFVIDNLIFEGDDDSDHGDDDRTDRSARVGGWNR